MSRTVGHGDLSNIILWERSYWFSTPWRFFVALFLLLLGLKNDLIFYKVYILGIRYVEKCQSDYWFVAWVEKPYSANCWLVVPIVVSPVHQKLNYRCLIHKEFNSVCIGHLWFRFLWTWHTTIGTTSPQFLGDEFQPSSGINNHFSIFYLSCT